MRLLFCRSNLIGSVIIRLLTASKWSHVVAVDDEGYAIEAVWPKVRKVRVSEIIDSHTDYEFRTLDAPEDAWFRLECELGKGYDLSALINFWNPWRDWKRNDKWFCSELIAWASGLFQESGRVTPQMLYLLSKPTKLQPQ